MLAPTYWRFQGLALLLGRTSKQRTGPKALTHNDQSLAVLQSAPNPRTCASQWLQPELTFSTGVWLRTLSMYHIPSWTLCDNLASVAHCLYSLHAGISAVFRRGLGVLPYFGTLVHEDWHLSRNPKPGKPFQPQIPDEPFGFLHPELSGADREDPQPLQNPEAPPPNLPNPLNIPKASRP